MSADLGIPDFFSYKLISVSIQGYKGSPKSPWFRAFRTGLSMLLKYNTHKANLDNEEAEKLIKSLQFQRDTKKLGDWIIHEPLLRHRPLKKNFLRGYDNSQHYIICPSPLLLSYWLVQGLFLDIKHQNVHCTKNTAHTDVRPTSIPFINHTVRP